MKNKILVVDDAELNRDLLESILQDEFTIFMANDGDVAIEMLEEMRDDINAILLDLQMPKMDGFAVLDEMNKRGWLDKIPVLIISGERAVTIENRCFELGVSDFIHKPFEPSLIKNRIKNVVNLFLYKNKLEEQVEAQTKTLRNQNQLLQFQAERLEERNIKIIDILGSVVESRNLESGEHIKRVKGFTKILAYQMMEDYPEYELTEHKIKVIVSASSLHDVGKIAIPDSILLKPGRLTEEEFECMKAHTTKGCEILNNIEDIWDEEYRRASYEICRHHHERYDGRGYPDALKEDEIPISAQIVSIADVYDALVCERCYKDAIPKDEAFDMIINGKCGTFSPKLLDCFRKSKEAFEKLADEMK